MLASGDHLITVFAPSYFPLALKHLHFLFSGAPPLLSVYLFGWVISTLLRSRRRRSQR